MQQRSLRPRIGVLQYFVRKLLSQLILCGNVRQKNRGNGWNAVLSQTPILYFVSFVPSYLLFIGMFLIDCFLYESNTSCTSWYRSYFYSIMYTGKADTKMILHFINAGQRYNCWYWLKTHMCWFFLIRRYSQFPCLSFFVQASGEHESNRTIYNSLRWENWIVWHCLEFTV